MRDALSAANVSTDAIAYLNAHGPGTQQCDTAEAGLVDEVLHGIPHIYSIKQMVGHPAKVRPRRSELAAAALGYANGIVPAPPTVAPGHHRLLDGPTPMSADAVTLKTSLGMGGHNSAVVLAPAI